MRRVLILMLLTGACASTPSVVPDVSVSAPAGAIRVEPAPAATLTAPATVPGGAITASATGTPVNFPLAVARITKPDGTTCDVCVWLANSPDRRARGLMFVTDLGPAEAMAFLYPSARTGSFWMKNAPMPLSIAFYDAEGAYQSAFDMDPCLSDDCLSYRTPSDFLTAIEVPRGQLDSIGFVPGSTLRLIDLPCADT